MISVPSSLLFTLLLKNPKKAQALTLYVALRNAGGMVSGRRLAPLIEMSVTQIATWIKEFDEAIEQENRTQTEQQKALNCDVSEASTPSFTEHKPNKKQTVSKKTEHSKATQTPTQSASSAEPANNPSRVGARTSCKGFPLKGKPSTGTHEGTGFLSPSLKDRRDFQEIFREEMQNLRNIEIRTNSDKIVGLRKRCLETNGKVMQSKDALRLWNELFERREIILKAFKVAKTLSSTVIQGGETVENAILIVKVGGILLSGTRYVA
jgi:hypothetical protein